MPLQASGKQIQHQLVGGFIGVNLRLDPTDVGQGQLVQGVNIDLYETPGVIRARRGLVTLYSSLDTPQRDILVMSRGSIIHAAATTLYDNGNSISTALNPYIGIDMVEYKGVTAPEAEVFIANGISLVSAALNMYRYTSTTVGNWGIQAPADAPAVAAGTGTLSGDYMAKYTYVRKVGTTLVHESNPSPASASQSLSTEGLDIDVTASSDTSVTHIRIYRTADGGTAYLYDQEVTNTTATVTSTQADLSLGSAVDTDNDRPQPASILRVLRDRIWSNDTAVPNRLRYTKRFYPESQPSGNYIDIGGSDERITAITSIGNSLIVFTSRTKYRIVEADSNIVAVGGTLPFLGGSASDFIAFEMPSSRGCHSQNAVLSTGYGIIYPSKDGVFVAGEDGSERLISDAIQPLFLGVKKNGVPPIDFDRESNICAALHRNRYCFSYTSVESQDGNNDYTVVVNMDNGQCWFWDVGLTALLFDDAYDRYLGGDNDGNLLQLERAGTTIDYGTDDIEVTVETPTMYAVDPTTQAVYFYFRVDASVHASDTLTAKFYAGSTLKLTATITGNRTRQLIRLPYSSRGYTWRVILSYSGSHEVQIHGVESRYKTLVGS